MKEIRNAFFAEALNEIIKTGTGAIHSRYQKLPLNPSEMYQQNPENNIVAIAVSLEARCDCFNLELIIITCIICVGCSECNTGACFFKYDVPLIYSDNYFSEVSCLSVSHISGMRFIQISSFFLSLAFITGDPK